MDCSSLVGYLTETMVYVNCPSLVGYLLHLLQACYYVEFE